MNILIPHNWLLEHLETKAPPQKIQECLSLSGPSVESLETIEGEPVYDIEVTTNRVDSMSIRGIAREAAAILPEFNIKASLKPLQLNKVASKEPLDIKISNDPKLCQRILAVKLNNVSIKPSPPWLQKRLIQVGQRPLNNLIDITNYVMWEIGHPLHVFDYDRLKEKTIIVREAKKGETLITLDDKTHTLTGGEVIFDDGTGRVIDLPGIMGTKNTVVTNKTKNILLWIESVDAVKIRRASMGLAIRSQAAVLNEKNVDTELGLPAILRAIKFYQKIAKARVGSELVDIYPKKPEVSKLRLKQTLLDTYMGVELEPKQVKRILTNLGCKVEIRKEKKPPTAYKLQATSYKLQATSYKLQATSYVVTPPTCRAFDLQIPQDLIEEVARIYGYHNLPSRIMQGEIPTKTQETAFDWEDRIKLILSNWGLTEVYTYSLVSEELASLSNIKLEDHLKLTNPLSQDHVFLRRAIIPSHLDVIRKNPGHMPIRVFELANVYESQGKEELPHETQKLVITTTDHFAKAKILIEMLLRKLRVEYQFLVANDLLPMLYPQRTAMIAVGNKIIGYLGEIKPELTTKLDLVPPITSAVFATELLLNSIRPYPTYSPPPSHPPIIEDLTFVLPEKTYLGEVIEEITSVSRLVESVELKEIYQRNATFMITFRHPAKSLSDQEIIPVRKKIVEHLQTNFKARLVGELD